jgi:hypothetical protein
VTEASRLSEAVISRLDNWKFSSALENLGRGSDLSDPTAYQREAIEALAATFGNCGGFDGHMGTIVAWTVDVLTGKEAPS